MGKSIQEWLSKFFKGCLPQNLLSLLLNTLSNMSVSKNYHLEKCQKKSFVILGEFQQNISNTLFSKTLKKPYYRECNLAGKLIATNDGKNRLTLKF